MHPLLARWHGFEQALPNFREQSVSAARIFVFLPRSRPNKRLTPGCAFIHGRSMKAFLHSPVAALAVLFFAAALAFDQTLGSRSADLMASWIAGHFLHAGLLDHVYPGYTEAFTPYPHPAWPAFLEDTAYRGPVFPFIYPPIWAWAMGHIGTFEGFKSFTSLFLVVNISMLAATLWMAMRIYGPGMPPVAYMALGVLLLGGTPVGVLAVVEGQPQIFVSFLLVLAIERSRSGHQAAAGAALALAAALKLYPAIFALIWLATGERRALGSFAIVGAGLAGLSVMLTGWQLHRAFLSDLSVISDTVLVTSVSTNIQASVAQLFFAGDLVMVPAVEVGGLESIAPVWQYFMPGVGLTWLFKGLFVAVVAGIVWAVSSAGPKTGTAMVWPLALTLTALILPLTWMYYFIPGLAFLPGVIWRLGRTWGSLAFASVFLPICWPLVPFWRGIEALAVPFQLVGTLAMCALATAMIAVFWAELRRESLSRKMIPDGEPSL